MKEKPQKILVAFYRRTLSLVLTSIICAACFFGCFDYNEVMEMPNLQSYCFNLSVFFTVMISLVSLLGIFGQKHYKKAMVEADKKYFPYEPRIIKSIHLVIGKLTDIFVIGCFAISGHFVMAFLWLIHTSVESSIRKSIKQDKEDGIEDSEFISSEEWTKWKSYIFAAVNTAKTKQERKLVKDKISDLLKNSWGILKAEAQLKAKAQGQYPYSASPKGGSGTTSEKTLNMLNELQQEMIESMLADIKEEKTSKEKNKANNNAKKNATKDKGGDEVLEVF